jgi:uncharacterized membrane protein
MRGSTIPGIGWGLLVAASLSCVGQWARADALYGVTDLGTMTVAGLSNAGQVVGMQAGQPVSFQDGTTTPLDLPGISQWWPVSPVISPGGTIAYTGSRSSDLSGIGPTAHVIRDGQISDAGTNETGWLLGGPPYSIPHAVNDAGVVAGESHAFARWNRAFVSSPGPDGQYHPVGLGANGGTVSNALAVNGQGTVVGWTDVPGQWKSHAFVGSSSNDIGTLGGQDSRATGINNAGQVVGWSNIATDWKPPSPPNSYYTPEPIHAFLSGPDHVMHDLGILPGFANSAALAINATGQAVGLVSESAGINFGSDPVFSGNEHAVLFGPDGPVDLNSLIPSNSDWLLKQALGINDSGQIIGTGALDGSPHDFLLTPIPGDPLPVPEPGAASLFAIIAVAGAVRAQRERRSRREAARLG